MTEDKKTLSTDETPDILETSKTRAKKANEKADATEPAVAKKTDDAESDEQDEEMNGADAPAAVGKKPAAKDVDGEDANDDAADGAEPASAKSLGEIATVNDFITNSKVDGLQTLYHLCFDAVGKAPTIKRNLRKFDGFEFDAKSPEFEAKLEAAGNLDIGKLKTLCDALGVPKKGTKEELAKRICEFLLAPDGEEEQPEDEEDDEEAEEEDESDASSEVEARGRKAKPKPSATPAGGRGARGAKDSSSSRQVGRPRRATAGRSREYSSSDEEEEEYVRKTTVKRRTRDESDSGSDYNPSGGSESDARKKRASGARSAQASRGRPPRRTAAKRKQSDSDDEEETPNSSDEDSDAHASKKKKLAPATPGGRGRGRPPARNANKKVSESEEDEESDNDSDNSVEKKKPTNNVKAAGRNNATSPPAKGRTPAKRTAATATPAKENDADEEEVDQEYDEESEDEPLANKTKTSAPTDDEIRSYVKEILDQANLEEITMKVVCKKVYAKFPQFDLTHKKEYIKQTVKSLIAT